MPSLAELIDAGRRLGREEATTWLLDHARIRVYVPEGDPPLDYDARYSGEGERKRLVEMVERGTK